MAIITPYDNKIAIWHHKGQNVAEATIDALAQTIRRLAPAVTQVVVKTSDGGDWMGRFDNKAAMAIDGPDAIKRWVRTLQKYGLEFHAWCVPRGLNIDAEAKVIIETCQVPGVRSMILDVEPYRGFYEGGKATIRPLMSKIRGALPGAFHFGMAVDPRPQHYASIFPDEWFPFVNSVHLQVYWGTFQVSPEAALNSAYQTWLKFKRPLFPILQGHAVDAGSMDRARQTAVNTHHATGLSWWVLGQMGAADLTAINKNLDNTTAKTPPGTDGKSVTYGASLVVAPFLRGYTDGIYPGADSRGFGTYNGYNDNTGKFHPTNDRVANVWARWDPQIRQNGWYAIEVYVPHLHANTGKARYKLHGVKGQRGDVVLTAPQALYNHEWVTLGTFEIDATALQPGVVYLTDWTFEPGLELAFDAIRWRPVVPSTTPTTLQVIGNITYTAREIFLRGKQLGNRADIFSRVGDSITVSPRFLTPFGAGQYDLGVYRAELEPVVRYFSRTFARGTANAFVNPSLGAGNGWGADRIIQPGYAYTDICGNEMPLVCEYKNVRPAIALIMIGTNDSGGVPPEVYSANLRRIIEISVNMGVVPVVSTIPPKRLSEWDTARVNEWNTIIRSLAQQYQIPLWDYWYALQNLPNFGISPDGVHPSEPPDGATGRLTAANLQYGYTMRNLTALQVLKAMMSGVMY